MPTKQIINYIKYNFFMIEQKITLSNLISWRIITILKNKKYI